MVVEVDIDKAQRFGDAQRIGLRVSIDPIVLVVRSHFIQESLHFLQSKTVPPSTMMV
jgi:hypothetical protein